ncbi:UbiA family prenyltransferase [Arhodomonas sp. AD133]|uniref:UbiA family prenyltransferase n=1 Tax=Arhodomonas sp. AD133 TaxID=3415009 RepID=UPI003EBAE457
MSVLRRLWAYQSERFPLAKTLPLLAVFSAASINLSAVLADRNLPDVTAYMTGFVIAFVLFFQMRAADEVKDLDDDRRFRPERPIPRGLVSLRAIVGLGLAGIPVATVTAWLWLPELVWLLALVWLWLLAMSAEFGAPAWIKARPVLYLVSHMLIMPLIDVLLTGVEWLTHGGPHPALSLFFVLSFVNGCVLEIGRKTWAPASEREGVESYSRLWGPARAAAVWLLALGLALILLIGVGIASGHPLAIATIGLAGFLTCAMAARQFRHAPSAVLEKRIDALAGLWVLISYGAAGFVPVFWRGM